MIITNIWRVQVVVERTVKVQDAVVAEVQGSVSYQRLGQRIRFKYVLRGDRLTRHGVPQTVRQRQEDLSISDKSYRGAFDVMLLQASRNLYSKCLFDLISTRFGLH